MDAMTDQERREAVDRLLNPRLPDPFVSFYTGKMMRDLPPRRTLRERVRALAWWRRRERG